MSYRCQITGKAAQPGDKPFKLVTKIRNKNYYGERYNEETDQYEHQLVGRGYETVEELMVSQEGLNMWNALNTGPKVVND